MQNKNLDFFLGNIQDVSASDQANVENLMDLSIELLKMKDTKKISEEMQPILGSYEIVMELLDIESNYQVKKAYYYGRMYSIALLLMKQSMMIKSTEDMLRIVHKSRYLEKILQILDEKGMATGPELCEILGFQNRSSLSNLMKRVEEENLFNIRKIGNVNYYSLSIKGAKCNEFLKKSKQGDSIDNQLDSTICFAVALIDSIIEELTKTKPSVYNIISKANSSMKGSMLYNSKLLQSSLEKLFEVQKRQYVEYLRKITGSTLHSNMAYGRREYNELPSRSWRKNKQCAKKNMTNKSFLKYEINSDGEKRSYD